MILTTANSPTPAAATMATAQAQPAVAAPAAASPVAAPAPSATTAGADAGTQAAAAGTQAPATSQAFALWLGQQADTGMPALDAAQQPLAAGNGVQAAPAAATGDAPKADAARDEAAQDSGLAAMALPLLPLPALLAAQALQAMVPAFGSAGKNGDGAAAGAAANRSAGNGTVAALGAGADANQARGAMLSDATTVQPAAPAIQGGADGGQAAQGGSGGGSTGSSTGGQQDSGAGIALPAVQAAQPSGAADAATTRLSVHAAAESKDGAAASASTTPSGPSAAGLGAAGLVGAPAPAAPAADTVKLDGPPTAWRQSLQEALGERLNVQVTKNLEQAVIRLEPPQLGRIDIAIRHSAGTLEVNITASNGEVLRQLQNVSDNLRSDLSQRQFTEVAVTVAPAPKNAGSAPFGDPQQQGRGRQQDRDQESEPGRALAEAGNPSSAFSLDGRS